MLEFIYFFISSIDIHMRKHSNSSHMGPILSIPSHDLFSNTLNIPTFQPLWLALLPDFHRHTHKNTVSSHFRSFTRSYHDWYFKCKPELPDFELQNTGHIILKEETWIRTEYMKSRNSCCNVIHIQDRLRCIV